MGALGDLKRKLIHERGITCECCGLRSAEHAAHVFLNRDVRFAKYLDVAENIALVCLVCHGFDRVGDPFYKFVDTWAFRRSFMITQSKRYNMLAWLESLPAKKKLGERYQECLSMFFPR